jgi:DNA replication licensing factor MCM7
MVPLEVISSNYIIYDSFSDVRERVIAKGFSDAELQKCINIYTDDDVWMLAGNGQKLRWMRVADEDSDEEL